MVCMKSAAEGKAREEAANALQRLSLIGYYPPGTGLAAMAPALWVLIAWCSMVATLYAVGYLTPYADDPATLALVGERIEQTQVDIAARRAAWAFSGVTLGLTVILFVTCLVWAGWAMRGKAPSFLRAAVFVSVLLLLLLLIGSWQVAENLMPFTSKLGQRLLRPETSGAKSALAVFVPGGMFVLACVLPCVLVAGAALLLQPMALPSDLKLPAAARELVRTDQLEQLRVRVREMDQMLYIGALALVFGTLQLSAGLSVPLASMPKPAAVKAQTDLCKALAPASAASTFFEAASATSPLAKDVHRTCSETPARFVLLDAAESLRQLARGITLSVGLAFSALLASVYVPAILGLRAMIESRSTRSPGGSGDERKSTDSIAELDPLHRLAALAATLGPLFAGLLANTVAAW